MEEGRWARIEEELAALEMKLRRPGAFAVRAAGEEAKVEEEADPNAYLQRLLSEDARVVLYLYLHPRTGLDALCAGTELDRQRARLLLERLGPVLVEEEGSYSLDPDALEGTELWHFLHALEAYYLELKHRSRLKRLHEAREARRRPAR